MTFRMHPEGTPVWPSARRAAVLLAGLGLWLSLAGCAAGAGVDGFVPSPSFDTPHPVTAGPSPTLRPPPAASATLPVLDDSPTATFGVLPTSGPTVTRPATLPAT